jgi:hypothetical protein
MPASIRQIGTLAAAAAILAAPALAADTQPRVQLQVVQVKATNPAGTISEQPVTVLINTSSSQASEKVCSVAARVRDAVNQRVTKETYKLDKDGKLDTAKIAADLTPGVKAAGGPENVVSVNVQMGGPHIKGAAATAFARTGCIGASQIGDDEDKPKKEAPPKKAPSGH